MREMVGDGEFRSSLVNELHELIAFLQTRLSEAGVHADTGRQP